MCWCFTFQGWHWWSDAQSKMVPTPLLVARAHPSFTAMLLDLAIHDLISSYAQSANSGQVEPNLTQVNPKKIMLNYNNLSHV